MTDPVRLRVNPAACSGHGVCAELLPELVTLDEWGYPVIDGAPVPPALARHARLAPARQRTRPAPPITATAMIDV
jgi:ferredoxin